MMMVKPFRNLFNLSGTKNKRPQEEGKVEAYDKIVAEFLQVEE